MLHCATWCTQYRNVTYCCECGFRLLLDANVGSVSGLVVTVINLLTVLCSSEPVQMIGIFRHYVILESVLIKLWWHCSYVYSPGARFTKNLETILWLSWDSDQTYDNLKIILWQCWFTNKKLSYRRETAQCFVSLNILLSRTRSLKMIAFSMASPY